MPRPRFTRAIAGAAVPLLSVLLAGTAASAAADTTPPTQPQFGYAQGFYCRTLIISVVKSTDNVTPQADIRYEVFAEGTFIGPLVDRGNGPWGTLVLPVTGPNHVYVQAIDAAGNRSAPSRTVTVTGYYTPGCTPGHI